MGGGCRLPAHAALAGGAALCLQCAGARGPRAGLQGCCGCAARCASLQVDGRLLGHLVTEHLPALARHLDALGAGEAAAAAPGWLLSGFAASGMPWEVRGRTHVRPACGRLPSSRRVLLL